MQPAERAEEESDDLAQPATMQPAERAEEESDDLAETSRPSADREAQQPGYMTTAQCRGAGAAESDFPHPFEPVGRRA